MLSITFYYSLLRLPSLFFGYVEWMYLCRLLLIVVSVNAALPTVLIEYIILFGCVFDFLRGRTLCSMFFLLLPFRLNPIRLYLPYIYSGGTLATPCVLSFSTAGHSFGFCILLLLTPWKLRILLCCRSHFICSFSYSYLCLYFLVPTDTLTFIQQPLLYVLWHTT